MNEGMMGLTVRESELRKRLDADAVAAWVHPADTMDGEGEPSRARVARDEEAREHTLEAMRRILAIVIPPPGTRDDNRWRAAFGRFMALVYYVAPEYAEAGSMRELAEQLHVDERTLRLRMAAVREALDIT